MLKVIAIGVVTISMIACASQKNESSSKQGGKPNTSEIISQMDANKDGKLSKAEVKGPLAENFSTIDSNNDGFISEAELEKAPKPERGNRPSR